MAYDLVGDEAFSASSLNATAQIWHARLLARDITATAAYNAAYNATDDLYGTEALSDTVGHCILALLTAFRMTGDLHILDMIDVIMERAKHPLIDLGYMLSVDHMSLNGVMALLAQMTYVYKVNSGKTSPSGVDYSARYTQWYTYLIDTYVATYSYGFYTGNALLRHRGTAFMRGAWYMWRLTGRVESFYEASEYGPYGFYGFRRMMMAENRTDIVVGGADHMGQVEIDGRWCWDAELPYIWGSNPGVLNWQHSNYARYTLANALDMWCEGAYMFSTSSLIKYAKTAWYIIQDIPNIRDDMNTTSVNNQMTYGQWQISSLVGCARWNTDLLAIADADWVNVSSTVVEFPAWMLFATA